MPGMNDAPPDFGLFPGGIARHIAQHREAEQFAQMMAIVAIAFAAFCVWLVVRIVNRRERWAMWTLAEAVGMPVLYVASIGPAIHVAYWLDSTWFMVVYEPLEWAEFEFDQFGDALRWYLRCWGIRFH